MGFLEWHIKRLLVFFIFLVCTFISDPLHASVTYPIVGTGQTKCYDNSSEISPPQQGQPFYGQDAQHTDLTPRYKDNGDGTISDLNTGLMWVKDRGEKMAWDDAINGASACRIGGYSDWRMPTIKELYSLIDFRGGFHQITADSIPYIDTKYFGFKYGDEAVGERGIDCQDWSATEYIGKTMHGNSTVFGVNFADGRIKGYPKTDPRSGGEKQLYVRYVRGNPAYGKNDFFDNGDGTITDRATGLMWSKADSGQGMNWQEALAWVQQRNAEKYLGHSDWRLPSAKELQSIVDYARAPAVTHSAAISPFFQVTQLSDGDYPFFWTSTTHLDGSLDLQGSAAVYIAFGRATGWMKSHSGTGASEADRVGSEGPEMKMQRNGSSRVPPQAAINACSGISEGSDCAISTPDGTKGGKCATTPDGNYFACIPNDRGMPSQGQQDNYQLLDVHGAGAQRSDPKAGDPALYPHGRGPQGDVIRIYNFVRCVRDANT